MDFTRKGLRRASKTALLHYIETTRNPKVRAKCLDEVRRRQVVGRGIYSYTPQKEVSDEET